MKTSELAKEAVRSGITPIELSYYAAAGFDEDADLVLRSVLVISSLELGTLSPSQYRYVARRSKQGDALVERHLQKLLPALPQLMRAHRNLRCVTVPVFPRLLKEGRISALLFQFLAKNPQINVKHLCMEFSADILYEDPQLVRQELDQLKQMGVQLAISEAGEDSCPLARLTGLGAQYIFADSLPLSALEADDAAAENLVRYLHMFDAKVFAPQLTTQAQISAAVSAGFDGFTATTPLPAPEVEA